jgi:hypothetical protein
MADDKSAEANGNSTTPTRRDVAARPPSERARLIERARREVPALRQQVATNLAELRRIANQ